MSLSLLILLPLVPLHRQHRAILRHSRIWQSGEIPQGYPVNIIRGFNRLPEETKRSLLDAKVTSHERFDDTQLYLVLRTQGTLVNQNIPVIIGTGDKSNFLLLLPPVLRPGTWMFTFEAREGVRLGQPVRTLQDYGLEVVEIMRIEKP